MKRSSRAIFTYIRRTVSALLLSLFVIPTGVLRANGLENAPLSYRIAYSYLTPDDLNPNISYQSSISPVLTPGIKKATVINLFAQDNAPIPATKFMEMATWKDLELFSSVFPKIDRTTTVFGNITLAHMLVRDEPLVTSEKNNSYSELDRMQQVVKLLMEDQQSFDLLERTLQSIKKAESNFLIFFLGQNSYRQQALRSQYVDRSAEDSDIFNTLISPFVDEQEEKEGKKEKDQKDDNRKPATRFFDLWDSSPFWLLHHGMSKRMAMVMGVVGFVNGLQNMWHLLDIGNRWRAGRMKTIFDVFDKGTVAVPVAQTAVSSAILWKLWNGLVRIDNVGHMGSKLALIPQVPSMIKRDVLSLIGMQKTVQQDLINLSRAIRAMKHTAQDLTQYSQLQVLLPECDAFFELGQSQKGSKDMQKLMELLNMPTFRVKKPSVFSHFGNIYAANHLMNLTKKEWAKVFKAIGYLDVYLSLAKLLKESQGSAARYTFAQFCETDNPFMVMKGFWNPAIDPQKAVLNDIDFSNGIRSIIITGPNGAGKSTVLRSVALNVLLAHTLGIVACQEMIISPMRMLNSSIHGADNIGEGLSKFIASVEHAQRLDNKVSALAPHEKCFTVADELFNGISVDEGPDAVCNFAKKFNKKNALSIFATHWHKPIDLEETVRENGCKVFANYKVEADEHADGQITYNHKLKRGWTKQNIARHILNRYGLGAA